MGNGGSWVEGVSGFWLRFDFEKAQQRLGSVALLSDILEYCENRIHTSSLPDFPGAVNGLQIENNGQIFKIGAAVDAGLVPFQNAVKAGIDFLIVHHGLFWEPAFPITGTRFRKYKICFENNLAVYSAHLPLDCHPEIGNNSLLAHHLGLKVSGQFLDYEGQKIGLLTEGLITRNEIRKRLEGLFPKGIIGIEKGGGKPAKIAIVTGSGGSAIPELAKAGVDTLITGELRQHHFNQAEEDHLNLYACGHYATETFGVSALAKELAERFKLDWEFVETDCPL